MSVTIEAVIVIGIFALVWGWIIYEMYHAPEMDNEGNIINKDDRYANDKKKERQFDWVDTVFKDKKEDVK
tara:strand:- start:407 stop:616 length:210 start_codon:yes stop_codon:yes gene_type:complete